MLFMACGLGNASAHCRNKELLEENDAPDRFAILPGAYCMQRELLGGELFALVHLAEGIVVGVFPFLTVKCYV